MALPAPDLDDRRFQDIVDEAKRLIPRYCPEWTNHNVSDPGVALIELFAWMSELVLYRLNQVPDRFYARFLELVGIEPFPPAVARADLTFWLSAVMERPVVIPRGTQVATGGASGREQVTFTTTSDLQVGPPVLTAALTAPGGDDELTVDVWDALRHSGGSVTCFTSTPLTPSDALYLGFRDSLAGTLLRVSVEAGIEGIGVDPTHPPLAWEVWSGEAWLAARVHGDTTGGLNRNGSVLLVVPMAHAPLTMGGTAAYWLRARLLPPVAGQPTYQASPQLRSIDCATLGGTVASEHATPAGAETLGRSVGQPGQSFTVSRPPVLPRHDDEVVRVLHLDEVVDWQEVPDFTLSGPRDRHVVIDGAAGTVRFGPEVRYPDGSVRQHGAVPPDGAEIVLTGYRHGGGAMGNVGAGTLTALRTTLPFVDRASNLVAASGGVDAESVPNAKLRGPMTLRTGLRAVTASDFERITLEASTEVARARCLPAAVPGGPVRVLVVPHVAVEPARLVLDDFALPAPLLDRVSAHLSERRLVGTTVEVGTPYYQGVSVAALLRSLPGRPARMVQQRALDLLTGYLNPLTGGAEGTGWPFDVDLNTAALTQMLESVDGVERVEEVLLFEYDLRNRRRLGVGRDTLRLGRDSLFLSAAPEVVVR